MEDSYQNPDHPADADPDPADAEVDPADADPDPADADPADAEVGWKCDEFLSGPGFYPDDAFAQLEATTMLPLESLWPPGGLQSEVAYNQTVRCKSDF